MSPTDERPVLGTYVVWHPHAVECASQAEFIFRTLCADPDVPAAPRVGIPIWFRTSNVADQHPAPVPFGTAVHTVVVVLVDGNLVSSPVWREYADRFVNDAGAEDLVIPVSLTPARNLPPALATLQAIRLHDMPPPLRRQRLLNDVMHDLSRRLDPAAAKVGVFLSHAKQDGMDITRTVRRYFHEIARLDDFFDAADIPDGTRFAEFITETAGSLPVLLAIQTDAYASREWCRLEVLEAKRRRVPIVVLSAVQTGENRSFPYMGNVPVICWRGDQSLPLVAGAVLAEVLRARYFPPRAERTCRLHGRGTEHEVFTSAPELVTALVHRAVAAAEGRQTARYLYPDPPLGTEEIDLLRHLDPGFDAVTLTMLRSQ